MRMRHFMVAGSMAIWILNGVLSGALAEDVVTTQTKVFRGQVLSVDTKGIRIALASGGETIIPRSLVVGTPQVTPPPSVIRGIEAYEKGNLKAAQLNLSKVAGQYQGLDVEWAMKGILYYGRACLAAGDAATAGKMFSAFLDAYEDDPMAVAAQIGQASIEVSKKNYEQALTKLRELADQYDKQLKVPKGQLPYAAEIYMDIAKCLEAQAKDSEALDAYLKVTALYPVETYCPEALYQAARLYRKLDQPEKARALYSELIDGYADNELAKQAVQERASLPQAAPGSTPGSP